MLINIMIEEIKGGWLVNGTFIRDAASGPIALDRASAATEKQIPARIKDIIAPLFAETEEAGK